MWVKKPTPTPEDTRKALENWLPFDLWSEVNHLMVGFGQTICLPIGPLCQECLNNDICPSSVLGKKSPKKKSPMKTDNDFEVKKELKFEKIVPEKSPRKRKVTPKKNDNEKGNFEIQTETITIKVETNNKSPKVRKVTPKKNLGEKKDVSDDDLEVKSKHITIKVETNKKSPRKVTPKKDKEDNKSEKIVINVKSNEKLPKTRKLTLNKIQNNNTTSEAPIPQTKPVKKNTTKQDKEEPPKKSPRTKKVDANVNGSENDEKKVKSKKKN